MKGLGQTGRRRPWTFAALGFAMWCVGFSTWLQGADSANDVRLVSIAGLVEVSQAGATDWLPANTNMALRARYRIRTGQRSRAVLLWADRAVATISETTVIEILPEETRAQSGVHLWRGLLSFFHRDEPGRIRVHTRSAMAGIKGTEFVVAVDPNTEATTLSVIDGLVTFSNPQGELTLTNLEQAVAELGQPPRRTPGFTVNHVLQWCFYYPGVLDTDELPLSPAERQLLADSLKSYRDGDLLEALKRYPANRQPESPAERVYYAALLLAVGLSEQADAALVPLERARTNARIAGPANALRLLIATVKREGTDTIRRVPVEMAGATEALALSYYEQSRATGDESLQKALEAAQRATEVSPNFGFAWARVAELEFSFGRIAAARQAVERSRALAPRNAEALALQGFLLAAQNKTRAALDYFDQAIAIDPALGNAWLGRGLAKIRLTPDWFSFSSALRVTQSYPLSALDDLLIAAAVEPERALLRSYLGRAWSDAGDDKRALHELELARNLDAGDPTAWLYSALIEQRRNRINEAIDDLETSQAVGENRRLYTSQVLLDEQRAARGVNLATAYKRAGLDRQSLREATEAVSHDYASYGAHQFLSDSFNTYRDPTRFNLRFETVWFNERLLANLLGRVGDTPLSQHFSQHEYSSLFARDGMHVSSLTDYRTDGQWLELASQYGRFGDTAWAVDLDYQHNDGVRPNNELDRLELYGTIKQQLTLQDSVMLLTKYQDYQSGDNFQYYDPTNARPYFRFEEQQSPLALLAYHHEWEPGIHTLFLGGLLQNDQTISDREAGRYVLTRNASDQVTAVSVVPMDVQYQSQFEIYTAELNQILRNDEHTLVAGGRYQAGVFETRDRLTLSMTNLSPFFNNPPAADANRDSFERISVYGYYTWNPRPGLYLTPGVSYDQVLYPVNHRSPPISDGEDERSSLNPKAGVVWSPNGQLTLRGAYSRSLGGVSFDESFRLEPTQLAGFQQAFRSLTSESLVGSVSAPLYEIAGAAMDWKLKSRTYLGLQVDALESDVRRRVGVFNFDVAPPVYPSSTRQQLEYDERSFTASVNQLLSDEWAAGLEYRFTRSELRTQYPDVPSGTPGLDSDHTERADLQRVTLQLRFNHPSGFFAYAESQYYHQSNEGYSPARPAENLFQENLFAGYRLPRERGEISAGVLNLLNEDYRLNPLNPYLELPRERVFVIRLRFNL